MTTFERCDVYRNLNRHCVSVRLNGRVVAHPANVVCSGVVFRVQAGGLAAMRVKGQRAVCAYARAERVEVVESIDAIRHDPHAQRVHFRGFESDHFTLGDGRAVVAARVFAMASPVEAWAIDPEVLL